MNRPIAVVLSVFLFASACANVENDLPFEVSHVTSFDEPWALAFLPDGRMLVTEKKGNLFVVSQDGKKSRPVRGMPDVDYGGYLSQLR
jgi:glucose/arabinose dehydrogenase